MGGSHALRQSIHDGRHDGRLGGRLTSQNGGGSRAGNSGAGIHNRRLGGRNCKRGDHGVLEEVNNPLDEFRAGGIISRRLAAFKVEDEILEIELEDYCEPQ